MLQELIRKNKDNVKHNYHKCLGFWRSFDVLEMKQGPLYIQTTDISETEEVTTYELFFIRDKQTSFMRLVNRKYEGRDHNDMRSYDRDTELPIWSKVRVR